MISVVIPVYNHQQYLADAIHSCLACSEVSEILVGDDGSTDRSRDVIRYFVDNSGGRVMDLTDSPVTNVGAHNRINQLCRSASNEWIAVLNSDDRFEAGRFRNFAQFVKYKSADLVFGNCAIIGSENEALGYKYGPHSPEYPWPPSVDIGRIALTEEWLTALLNQNFVATTSNMVFRKSLFDRLGGFAPYRYIHDWDFMIRAAACSTVVYNPNMWVNYRIHSSNTISESSYKVKDEVNAMIRDVLRHDDIVAKLRELGDGAHVDKFLSGNRYLVGKEPITFVFPEPYHINAADLASEFPDAKIVSHISDAVGVSDFIYAPLSMEAPLSSNDIRNLVISAAIDDVDFAVCENLTSAVEPEEVIRNQAIWRPETLLDVARGDGTANAKGKIVRIPRGSLDVKPDMREIMSARYDNKGGAAIYLGGHRSAHPTIQLQNVKSSGLIPGADNRPVIFVFPAVVAIGGAENVLIEIMKNLNTHYRFVLVSTQALTSTQGNSIAAALEYAEAYFDLTELCASSDFLHALAWLKSAYRPQILFLTNGSMWQIQHAWQIRKLFRDAAIVDHQVYDAQFGWVEWLQFPSLQASDCYIAVTRKIQERFRKSFGLGDKAQFIPHPINADRIRSNLPTYDRNDCLQKFGLSSELFTVSFVGRMVDQKRPWLFLDLAEHAKRDGLPIQFVMVGQGELAAEMADRIAADALDNVVRLQNVSPLEELYFVTDLLVITSAYEGLPLAMLEAMSAGVPVVSTDAGDINDVLTTYFGRRAEPVDVEFEEFYKRFCEAIDDIEQLRVQAHAKAGEILEFYSGENIAAKYKEVFEIARTPYATLRGY